MKTVVVLVKIVAKPGSEAELQRRLRVLIEPSLLEEGCIAYYYLRSSEEPATWLLYEYWRDQRTLDMHQKSKHLAAYMASSHEVLAQAMSVEYYYPDTESR